MKSVETAGPVPSRRVPVTILFDGLEASPDVRIGARAGVGRRASLERLRRRSSESLKALSLREVKLPDGQIIKPKRRSDPRRCSAG